MIEIGNDQWQNLMRHSADIASHRQSLLLKRSDELRSMAAHLRNMPVQRGEIEIWMHNWARTLERVALEMECFAPPPARGFSIASDRDHLLD